VIQHLAEAHALEQRAEQHFTPCGDGQMVWRMWGPADGAPLILLHGGSGSWNHWVRNIDALVAAGRRVVCADMPGCGDSAKPPEGEDADIIPPWLERGCQQLYGDRQLDIVGFSFGGLTAGLWAHQYPARFRSLVFVGAPSLTSSSRPNLELRRWLETPPGPERDAIHRYNLRHLMLAHDRSINLLRDRMRGRRLSRTDVLREKVPLYPCILGGIYGVEDILYVGRLDSVERSLARAPRFHSLTAIEQAGHWAQYENAADFNAALVRFLRETDGL